MADQPSGRFSYAQAAKAGEAAQEEQASYRGQTAHRGESTQKVQAMNRSRRGEESHKDKEAEKGKSGYQDNRNEQTARNRQKRQGADTKKPHRSINKDLTVGAIFLATHCEEAGDRVDQKPRIARSPETDVTTTPFRRGATTTEEGEEALDEVDDQGVTRCPSHMPIVIKDRKFIVLFVHHFHYECIPLFTYNKAGAKDRPDRDDHVSVWDHRATYHSHAFKQQTKWRRLETAEMESSAHFLSYNAAARITYPVARPKNLPIEYLGRLEPESVKRLRDLHGVLHGSFDEWEAVKQELIAKHTDPAWTTESRETATRAASPPSVPISRSLGLRPREPSTPSPMPRSDARQHRTTPHTRGSSERARVDFAAIGQGRKDWAMKAEAIARARMEEEDEEDALRGIGVQDQKKRKTPGGEFGGLDGVYEGGEGGETMLRVRKKRKRMMASKDGGQRDAGKRKRVRWDLEEEDTKVIEQQVRVRRSGRKKMKLV